MEVKKSLNTDIPGKISELQAAMKEFILKHRLYRILLRGKGLEFESYRSYAQDDDADSIDWKASKRANTLLVKQYSNERDLKIVFVLDVGENMVSGIAEKLKCEYAAEVVAAFSHLITSTGDKTGYLIFSDEVKTFVGPSRGNKHFARLVDTLTNPSTYGGTSNLEKALDFVSTYIGKNVESIVIVSDFTSFNEKSRKGLALISKKFETVALAVNDPLDKTFPDFPGEIVIEDSKTGQQLLIEPTIAKKIYETLAKEKEDFLKKACLDNNVDLLEIMTDKPFVPSLSEFLKGRTIRKGFR